MLTIAIYTSPTANFLPPQIMLSQLRSSHQPTSIPGDTTLHLLKAPIPPITLVCSITCATCSPKTLTSTQGACVVAWVSGCSAILRASPNSLPVAEDVLNATM